MTYTTTWTPPDAVTNFSATGDDTRGYVVLDWDTSSLSGSDFLQYKVYKSTDGGNNWTVLATITNQATSHYDDYPASFSTPYTYKVTQWKNISGGSPLESPDSDIVTTSIDGDEWWLVVDGRDDLSFVLYVDDESHSSPFQQEIFEPFGRSRKVIVRSGIWGREGSLSFYILSENRIDYLNRLAGIQALTVPVYLKNPFGDTHLVYLEPATVTYLPGGGARVSVNYTEVES